MCGGWGRAGISPETTVQCESTAALQLALHRGRTPAIFRSGVARVFAVVLPAGSANPIVPPLAFFQALITEKKAQLERLQMQVRGWVSRVEGRGSRV
jgi:hypothetical protein